jgi:hypothetical protein
MGEQISGALISRAARRKMHNIKPRVGFQVLTAVDMKSLIFWDIMLCSSMKVNRHFRGTYCHYLQCQSVNQARNLYEAGRKQSKPHVEKHRIM